MRRSKWNALVFRLAVGSLWLGLAACDQTQDTTSEADALPLYTVPPTESTVPASAEKDNAASGSERDNSDRSEEAASAATRPDRSATTPMAAPSAAATRPPPDAQPTPAPDPHAGHDMPSMSDHDMDGM